MRYYAQRTERIIRKILRASRAGLPMALDLAGYAVAVWGVWELAGPGWGKLAAAAALIIAGIRAAGRPES